MAFVAESVSVFHQDPERSVELTKASVDAFENGESELNAALISVGDMATFLGENWDPEFDARLRSSGFNGSLFILRQFKMHLESIRQTLRDVIEGQHGQIEPLSSGTMEKDPFFGSTTRLMCQAIIRFLEFEDDVAQTRTTFFT
jgi:hypothetical protein